MTRKSECTKTRACPKYGLKRTPEGHDPCIANLPGVSNACCGHGVRQGYIQFTDGREIRGYFTEIGWSNLSLPILPDGRVDGSKRYIAQTDIGEFDIS